ncbi:MAG TPA: helix-turn-helix domain-containing protein [Leucothrix sp.]|nr:helix-turn-helix domain-containing protein [Leucothrix sp.]
METNKLKHWKSPKKLIKGRISFAGLNSEVSIYDTYEAEKGVEVTSKKLVFVGIISGRINIHTSNFDGVFSVGESFLLAPEEIVKIDFPDASLENPTICLVVEISSERVNQVNERQSDSTSALESIIRQQNNSILHLNYSTEIECFLSHIDKLFSENHADRDKLIDLQISELTIRLLRHDTRKFILAHSSNTPEAKSLNAALRWIESTLSTPLDIRQLCLHACMSRSRLYVEFKNKLGCSPVKFQQQLRLKHAALRIRKGESITVIGYDLGFNNPSHFSHSFKNFFGCSATDYRQRKQS